MFTNTNTVNKSCFMTELSHFWSLTLECFIKMKINCGKFLKVFMIIYKGDKIILFCGRLFNSHHMQLLSILF